MIGTTAIARAPYGQGRVIVYSPHPEKKGGLHDLILHGAHWAATGEESQIMPANEPE